MRAWLTCICVVAVLFIIACSQKDEVPKDVLPKDQMQNVLWDLIQADKFAVLYVSKDSAKNLQQERIRLYEDVFRIHRITKEKFDKSYKFYLSRPDIAKVIFDSLSSSAERRRSEVYAPLTPKDSTAGKKLQLGTPSK